MKNKILLSILLTTILFSCTKNSGVMITFPNKDLILEKLDGKNYSTSEEPITRISFSGGKANIDDANYTFEKEVFAIAAFYKKDGSDGEYILVFPKSDSVDTFEANQKAFDAINLILGVIDTEKDGAIVLDNFIKALATKSGDGKLNIINADEILKGASISQEKEAELRASLSGLNTSGKEKDFKDGKTFKRN